MSTATQKQRAAVVQDVLVQREDEIAKCRRDYHELLEQLKQYEIFYRVDQHKVKMQHKDAKPFKSYGSNTNNRRGRQNYDSDGGRSDRGMSRSRSPGYRSRATSRSPSRSGRHSDRESDSGRRSGYSSSRGGRRHRVTTKAKRSNLRDVDHICDKMSTKVARQVLVLEMQRMSDKLKESTDEASDLKEKLTTEMSKNINMSKSHHILCDRLANAESNDRILSDTLTEILGLDRTLEVLEAAMKKGYNRRGQDLEDPSGTMEDFNRVGVMKANTRLNATGGAKSTPRKRGVDISTQDDLDF